jgi:uncharacterized protein
VATYAVTITYGDTALRDKIRPIHREYLTSLFERNVLICAGPFTDDSGAMLVYEAESDTALEAILSKDPYWVNTGCLSSVSIKEWNRVFARA